MNTILKNAYELYIRQYNINKESINIEDNNISNINEMYCDILCSYISKLCAMGLYKEYVQVNNVELSSPRGRISIEKSISRLSMIRGKLVCSYQELTENNDINKVVKALIKCMLENNNISEEKKTKLKTLIKRFNGVDDTSLMKIELNRILYNNMTIRYKPLTFIAKDIVNEKRLSKYLCYSDDIRIYNIYKSQLYKNIVNKYRHNEMNVDLLHKEINKECSSNADIYCDKSGEIVGVRGNECGILIETRIYDSYTRNNPLVRREQAKELSEKVVEYSYEHNIKATGVILYVNTCDKYNLIMDRQVASYNGKRIISEFIDLNDSLCIEENKIDEICKSFIY